MSKPTINDTPTLFGFAPSTYTRTARLALEEKRATYDLVPPQLGSPEYLKTHPFGKMPALRHGKTTVYETPAIVTYVDETFSGPALQPAEPAARLQQLTWMSALADYYYDELVMATVKGDSEVSDRAKSLLGILDSGLTQSEHIVGSQLSLADLLCVPMLAFFESKHSLRDLGFSHAASYLKRFSERPSFINTLP